VSVDIVKSQGHTFIFRPATILSSPTAKVLDTKGSTLESPTPTVDSVSTTVAASASNSASSFVVSSAAGIARGKVYQITDPTFGAALSEVSSVDGTTVTLVEPLPTIPDATSTFLGIEVTVVITSTSTGTLGMGSRVVLAKDGLELVEVFNVVRHPWQAPLDARKVRHYIAQWWASDPLIGDEEAMENIADAGNKMLRGRLLEVARYPHLVWDADALEEAGQLAMMIHLAEHNRIPGNADPIEYRRSLRFDLRDRVGGLAKSAHPYDDDDDDALDATEQEGTFEGVLYR
tara:strand:+ start:6520 stop:7386 length:867 start_codon:yes stop_codon:yes gene_type:complete